MSDALFYEFTGVSADDYKAVNAILGLDPATGGGDWPAGLLSHTGAAGITAASLSSRCGTHSSRRKPSWPRGWDQRSAKRAYPSRRGSSGCPSWGTTALDRSDPMSAMPASTRQSDSNGYHSRHSAHSSGACV
jgi:hypothetical protein